MAIMHTVISKQYMFTSEQYYFKVLNVMSCLAFMQNELFFRYINANDNFQFKIDFYTDFFVVYGIVGICLIDSVIDNQVKKISEMTVNIYGVI